MGFLQHLLSTASNGEQKAEKEFELIGNCFGFYGLDGGIGTSTLAFETAILAASQGLHTCFIDCSPLSNFALSKATQALGSMKEIPSIQRRFIKRTSPIAETLIPINETFKIMSFGEMPLSDTFNMSFDTINETYKEAKEVFDLVIMDIQNIPWAEPTIAAIKQCSTLYTICAPTPESIFKKAKLDNLMAIASLDSSFRNIVFGGVPQGLSVTNALGKLIEGDILGEYPYVPDFKKENLSNYSVLSACRGSEVRSYSAFLDYIITEILEGMHGKEEA